MKPVWRKVLDCPQLKHPEVVERLHVSSQVAFVLEHIWEHDGATANDVIDAYDRKSAGMQAILTRLRNGGYLRDGVYGPDGYERHLTPAGIALVKEIRQARADGYVLVGDTDPRIDKVGRA